MIKLNNDDGLGVPFKNEPIREKTESFKGRRFNNPAVITTKKPQEPVTETFLFPAKLKVVGVTKGPMWCESCRLQLPENSIFCNSCNGVFVSSLRQKYLEHAVKKDLGHFILKMEPENKYDSKAVAVYVKWTDGKDKQIGYIPAKPNSLEESLSSLTAANIFEFLEQGKTLWVTGFITGGPREGNSNLSYGCLITIHDKPPY